MKFYLFIFISFLTLGSCKPTITCEDVPCPYGQFCSNAGVCEFEIELCESNADCPTSEICDTEENKCVPEQLPCTDTFTCPLSQSCNALTGFCEPDSICSRDGCSVGETCNETTEQCTPSRCTPGRDDCPLRFLCSAEGLCESGCEAELNCPAEEFCLIPNESTRGTCVPSCGVDTDCPFGTTCERVGEQSRCEREPSCVLDLECRSDEVCISSSCVQPPCSENLDCDSNQFCDLARGKCTSLDCDDDIYSVNANAPNFSFESAARLEVGDYRNLRVCPGTQDWFKVAFRATDIVRVDLNIQSGAPLELRVLDSEGAVVARDSRLDTSRSFEFSTQHSGDFFFELSSSSIEKSIYDFKVQTQFCENDIYEDNDSQLAAKTVPTLINAPITLSLNACPNDVDWFALRNLNGEHGLELSFSESSLAIEGILITPSKEEIPITPGTPFNALKLGDSGDYYVRISVADQGRGSFNLAVESKALWDCPNAGLFPDAANAVSPNATIGTHLLCPESIGLETDWLTLPPVEGIVKLVVSSEQDYEMEALLWTGEAESPELYRTSTNFEDGRRVFYFEAELAKNYYLRMSSDFNGEKLLSLPRYTVNLTVEN